MSVSVGHRLTDQHRTLIFCFSLLLLGMFLATLATLNFSLSLFVGLFATPLSLVGPTLQLNDRQLKDEPLLRTALLNALLSLVSPTFVLIVLSSQMFGTTTAEVLTQAAFGWHVNGMRTQVVLWCVWWPAWLIGSVLVSKRP